MSPTVMLTVSLDTERPDDISALELIPHPDGRFRAGREAMIDAQEADAFRADCSGWDLPSATLAETPQRDRFLAGFGVVLTISANNWQLWLDGYELVDDPD